MVVTLSLPDGLYPKIQPKNYDYLCSLMHQKPLKPLFHHFSCLLPVYFRCNRTGILNPQLSLAQIFYKRTAPPMQGGGGVLDGTTPPILQNPL